ncbi:hypothetical protein [Streptomyces sp. enrichment culture]|uniref:hypothetical protein n=1 Tax=Streptomyces sp. enrichment culture TaxID=1795815 RepID=UPI003F5630A8
MVGRGRTRYRGAGGRQAAQGGPYVTHGDVFPAQGGTYTTHGEPLGARGDAYVVQGPYIGD